MKNTDAIKIWDMLRMALFSDVESSITFVYDNTEVVPGYQLMKARQMHAQKYLWPEVEILSLTSTEVRLKMHHEESHTTTYMVGNDMEEETLNHLDEIVVRLEESPSKIYVFGPDDAIRGCMVFDFMSFTYQIDEHDNALNQDYRLLIDDEDWEASCNEDAEAALRVADSVASQIPESTEIMEKYLRYAVSLGSAGAQDRLTHLPGN